MQKKEHGFITDDDAYLDSITERQDLCLNMTKMSDQEVMMDLGVSDQTDRKAEQS